MCDHWLLWDKNSTTYNVEYVSDHIFSVQTFKYGKIWDQIVITPVGSICFLLKGYGGRASDKFITKDCGVVDLLPAGRIVFADCGFTVHEIVAEKGATLVIPDFKQKETKQLTPSRGH